MKQILCRYGVGLEDNDIMSSGCIGKVKLNSISAQGVKGRVVEKEVIIRVRSSSQSDNYHGLRQVFCSANCSNEIAVSFSVQASDKSILTSSTSSTNPM